MTPTQLTDLQGKVFNLISSFGQVRIGCDFSPPLKLCISGNFADSDYGFVPVASAPCPSIYNPGGSWLSCHDAASNTDYLEVERVFDQATFIASSSFDYNVALLNETVVDVYFYLGGVQVFHQNGTLLGGGNINFASTVNQQADKWRIVIHRTGPPGTNLISLFDWSLCYQGDFPLALGSPKWTIVKDFQTSMGGFTPVVDAMGEVHAGYTGGVGFTQCVSSGCTAAHTTELRITKILAATHRFTSIRAVGDASIAVNNNNAFNFAIPFPNVGPHYDETQPCDLTTANLRFDLYQPGCTECGLNLQQLIFEGLGTPPPDL